MRKMGPVFETMKKVIEKCDICIGGDVISKETLLRAFYDFVLGTMEKREHNVGIVMHTGSVCFDAILLTCAAISNILYTRTTASDIVSSLEIDKLVLCYENDREDAKPGRYFFKGFAENTNDVPSAEIKKYAVLEDNNSGKRFLPEQIWHRIVPYEGGATATGRQGAPKGRKERNRFLKSILELQGRAILRVIDTSTVFVIPKKEANILIEELSFRFDDVEIKLNELVPVSYFADSGKEYRYGGNPEGMEPVIKIAGKVSTGRDLIYQNNGNKNIGIIIFGDDAYRRGEFEIDELLNMRRLQYVYICFHVDFAASIKLLGNYENAKLFACTKKLLLTDNYRRVNVPNNHTKQLESQINAIVNREIENINVAGCIGWEEYKAFKQAVYALKTNYYNSGEKEDFIRQSYSMMKLFMTAAFPIDYLDEYVDEERINGHVQKAEQRFSQINEDLQSFPDDIKKIAEIATGILETAYLKLCDKSPKEDTLVQIIGENFEKKIAIVVPKAYYSEIINDILNRRFPDISTNITIVTGNSFDNSNLYDLIIVTGNIEGTRFDIFRCRTAKSIKVLLYDAEKYQYGKKLNDARLAERFLDFRSKLIDENEYKNVSGSPNKAEINEIDKINEIDVEINNFITSTEFKAVFSKDFSSETRKQADIVAVAKFDTEEFAFFTKNYKAYVLDYTEETEEKIKEVSVDDLKEGDTIVFTRSNSRTRDIVENLIQYIISDEAVYPKDKKTYLKREYYKSREWKTTLIDYMGRTGKTAEDIAEEMAQNGHGSVQAVTIKGWIDEESYTVRPKKIETIRQIALITGNSDLFDNAEDCSAAGENIYRIRRKILGAIGQIILGETPESTDLMSIMAAVSEKIKDAAVIVQIEMIQRKDKSVPMYMVNRPVSMD